MPDSDYSVRFSLFLKIALFFAKKELKGRIAGSYFGFATLLLQPLSTIAILLFVFSTVLKIKLAGRGAPSFAMFLICGLLPWMQFQEAVTRATTSMIENAPTIKKTAFAREAIVVGVVTAVFLIYWIPMLIFGGYAYIKGLSEGKYLLEAIPWGVAKLLMGTGLLFIFSLGLGFILSSLCVYIRDVSQALPPIMQVWFYATPIVYPESMVPDKFKVIMALNPANWYISMVRSGLLYPSSGIQWKLFAFATVVSVIVFLAGYAFFKKLEGGFPDVL